MTVKLVLFSDRGWSSSAGKWGHCGYLRPRLSTPGQPARPKSLKGKRPRHQLAQERPVDPLPGYPKGIRPRNAQPILYRGARVSGSLDALFSSSAYFPNRQLLQAKLPTDSPLYKHEFTPELTPSPLTK